MTRHLIVAAACLAASPAPAQPVAGGPAPADSVRRDLESVFQPGASFDEITADNRTAARARLRTRPYATSAIGFCQRDEVIVSYAGPERRGTMAAENAFQPYAVTAESRYRALREVPLGTNTGRPYEGECASLDGAETRGWFAAPDVYVAADGYRAFLAAIRQLNEPRHAITGCRESRESREACRRDLPASALERIARIDRCSVPQRRFCYRVTMTDDSTVTLRLHYNERVEPRIDAVTIEGPPILI